MLFGNVQAGYATVNIQVANTGTTPSTFNESGIPVGPYTLTLQAPTGGGQGSLPNSALTNYSVFCDDLVQTVYPNTLYQDATLENLQDVGAATFVTGPNVTNEQAREAILQLVTLYNAAEGSNTAIVSPQVSTLSTALNLAIWKVLEDPALTGVAANPGFVSFASGANMTAQDLSNTNGVSGSGTAAMNDAISWLTAIQNSDLGVLMSRCMQVIFIRYQARLRSRINPRCSLW